MLRSIRAAVSAIIPDGVRITSRRGRGYRRGCYSYHAGLPHKYSVNRKLMTQEHNIALHGIVL